MTNTRTTPSIREKGLRSHLLSHGLDPDLFYRLAPLVGDDFKAYELAHVLTAQAHVTNPGRAAVLKRSVDGWLEIWREEA